MAGKRNRHPFTQDGVLAYMTDKRGTRYQCSYLARIFKVTTKDMRPILDALEQAQQINAVVQGTYRWFFIYGLEELILIERQKTVQQNQKRELLGYAAGLNTFRALCEGTRR
jgi:hypothetical protein